jgi:putative ABC transport system permease protein
MRLKDLLKLVWTNLSRTRFRAALSAAGVVIGTAAIVILFSLAAGLQAIAEKNLGGLGPLNEMNVMSLGAEAGGGGGVQIAIIGLDTQKAERLKPDYLSELAQRPGVAALTPVVHYQGQATVQHEAYVAQPQLKGLDPDALVGFNFDMQSGAAELGRWQVIVGAKVGESFSDPSISSGDNRVPPQNLQDATLTLKLTRSEADGTKSSRVVRVQVAGVLAPRGFDYDYSIFLRLSDVEELNTWATGKQVNRRLAGYGQATLLLSDAEQQARLEEELREAGFFTFSANELLKQINQTFAAFQAFVGGIAVVTFVIAGTGIANTLITAIYERTAEIGLMKAVGATTRQVMTVFLAEAAAIGGGGGLGGLAVGLLLSQIVNVVMRQAVSSQLASGPGGAPAAGGPIDIVATPLWLIVVAPLFAAFVGILAGLYPARRAAALDPVVALRYE